VLGIVFGSAGKWRLSTLRQLFAVSRIKPHVDDGAMGQVTGVYTGFVGGRMACAGRTNWMRSTAGWFSAHNNPLRTTPSAPPRRAVRLEPIGRIGRERETRLELATFSLEVVAWHSKLHSVTTHNN
jgi:hypothetical protein